ncbi:hypothetical protein [Silvimonas amylolytica]|uniref:hypothetical protein n=1 Tax=Silvimonas amylolytica TaxID=449663 RepID=UPI00166945BD|nr:hypothetical protein [Silvimonas amylolytica]
MRYIADDFLQESIRQNLAVLELPIDEVERIRNRVEEKYARKGLASLWQRIVVPQNSRHCPGGKDLLKFLPSGEAIIFFEKDADESAFRMGDLRDISAVVLELFNFVFYVTNESCDYLFCWNDHEFLIGAGDASEWISLLNSKRHPT